MNTSLATTDYHLFRENYNLNNNAAVFDWMKKTFVFVMKDFNYATNVITYQGESIRLGKFRLEDFYNYNAYIIGSLSTRDLFEILKVHADAINKVIPPTLAKHETTIIKPIVLVGEHKSENDKKGVISLDEFIILTNSKTSYGIEEMAKITETFNLMEKLLAYEDFLIENVHNVLNFMRNTIELLDTQNIKSVNQQLLISGYQKIVENAENQKTHFPEDTIRLVKTRQAGFVSALVIISVVINLGVLLGFLLFSTTIK